MMKRILTCTLACLLALTMLFALCACSKDSGGKSSNSSGFNTPEKAAKTFITARFALDADGVVDCYPDFLIKYMMGEYGISTRSQLTSAMMEEVEGEEKQSVKILDAEADYDKYDDDDLEEIKDKLKRRYDLTEKQLEKITELCQVKVTYKADGDEVTDKITCCKYDGNWYVLG